MNGCLTVPQLTQHEQQGRESHRALRDESALAGFDVAQQSAYLSPGSERRVVLGLSRGQGTAKVTTWIALRAARGHGVAKDLPTVLLHSVRRLDGAAVFDPFEKRQRLRGVTGIHRLRADPAFVLRGFRDVRGFRGTFWNMWLVERMRIELTTSALRTRRSPS